MPNTAHGYPYPTPTDFVTAGAAAIQALAEKIDTLLGVSASGSVSVTITASATGNVAVTFPPGRFTAPPAVTAVLAASSSTYVAGIGNVTKDGFTMYAFHKDGTATSVSVGCHWIARSIG